MFHIYFHLFLFFTSVSGNPLFILPDYDIVRPAGDDVLLTCKTFNDHVTNLTWLFKGQPLSTNQRQRWKSRLWRSGNETKLQLRVSDVTVTDNGCYTCVGLLRMRIEVEAMKQVTIVVKINLEETSRIQMFVEGEHAIVLCKFHGNPTPIITWMTPYSTDDVIIAPQHSYTGSSELVIDVITLRHAGVYVCRGVQERDGYTDEKAIEVIVQYSARNCSIEGPNQIIKRSDSKMKCRADGVPPPNYSWYRLETTGRKSLLLSNFSILDLSDLNFGGEIICEASNHLGLDSASINLQINIPPYITNVTSSVTCIEGGSIVMSCEAKGVPHPKITILPTQEDTKRLSDWSILNNKSAATLKIDRCQKRDSGNFSCRATNVAGSNEKLLHLDILYAPVDGSEKEVEACVGDVVTLICNVDAIPTPRRHWHLEGRGEDLRKFENFAISENASILKKRVTIDDFSKVFICNTSNQLGSTQTRFLLLTPLIPKPLHRILISKLTMTCVSMEIDVGNQSDSRFYVIVTNSSNDIIMDDVINTRLFEIKGLRHSSNYTITAAVLNCNEIKSEEKKLQFVTKDLGKPTLLLYNLIDESFENFSISWELNEEEEIEEINLKYSEFSGDKKKKNFTFKKHQEIFRNKIFLFPDLKQNQKYELEITAVNKIGSLTKVDKFMTPMKLLSSANDPVYPFEKFFTIPNISYVIIIIIIVFVLIDLICCLFQQCGFLHGLRSLFCGKTAAADDVL